MTADGLDEMSDSATRHIWKPPAREHVGTYMLFADPRQK